MLDTVIYFTALPVFFAIGLRVLMALHIEGKFEKMRIWEIKTAYFLGALVIAHTIAEIMVRVSELVTQWF